MSAERPALNFYAMPVLGLGLTVVLVVYAFIAKPPRPVDRTQPCPCVCPAVATGSWRRP